MANDINSNSENENEHLLEHSWTLWYRPPNTHNPASQAKTWETSQKEYFTAKTVEGFWRGFHKLPRITQYHSTNCDYSLFREGVKPMWEDVFNQHGGRWTYNLERRQNSTPLCTVIEQVWLDVMLCIIGEGFDPYGEMIAGGVCGIRGPKGNKSDMMSAKIHIWTKDASNTEATMKIGEILKGVLNASDGQLTFAPHDQSGSKGGRGGYNQGNLKL